MKVTVVDSATGRRHRARVSPDGKYVTIDACPQCGAKPAVVAGTGITHHDHDTYYAAAVATCCDTRLGTIEARVETLFGIDQDEAVLVHGRPRVYDAPSGGRP